MIIDNLSYLEDVVESSTVVGGKSYHIHDYCEYHSIGDKHRKEPHYYCYDYHHNKKGKSHSYNGPDEATESSGDGLTEDSIGSEFELFV